MFSLFVTSDNVPLHSKASETFSQKLIQTFQHDFNQSGGECEKHVFFVVAAVWKNWVAPFHLAVVVILWGGGYNSGGAWLLIFFSHAEWQKPKDKLAAATTNTAFFHLGSRQYKI